MIFLLASEHSQCARSYAAHLWSLSQSVKEVIGHQVHENMEAQEVV